MIFVDMLLCHTMMMLTLELEWTTYAAMFHFRAERIN